MDFGYNVAGEQTNIDRYVNPAEDLVAASDSIFDELGRLTHLTYQDGDTTTLAEYDWAIDDAGRITQMKSKADAASGYDWGVTGYTYDNGGQLTGAAYSDFANAPADESYGLDANGNRTSDDFTVVDPDGNNRMATGAGYRYSYDAEGNRTLRFVSEDDELGDGATDITRYIWDHRDRLTEVRHYATYTAYQSDAPDRVVEYAYDYQNRWVRKVVNPGTDAQEKTIFVYDGTQIAMQFDGTADATSTDPPLAASALSHRYLWGPKVDQILADEKLTGPTPEVLWTLGDHLNTVRDIVEYTGGVTTVTQHLVYNSFGTETSAIASSCLFGFTARPFDQDTGLQNNLNRWYEATTGRWVSEDPIGYRGGINLYGYVGNSPINATDPTGQITWRFDAHGRNATADINPTSARLAGAQWAWVFQQGDMAELVQNVNTEGSFRVTLASGKSAEVKWTEHYTEMWVRGSPSLMEFHHASPSPVAKYAQWKWGGHFIRSDSTHLYFGWISAWRQVCFWEYKEKATFTAVNGLYNKWTPRPGFYNSKDHFSIERNPYFWKDLWPHAQVLDILANFPPETQNGPQLTATDRWIATYQFDKKNPPSTVVNYYTGGNYQ